MVKQQESVTIEASAREVPTKPLAIGVTGAASETGHLHNAPKDFRAPLRIGLAVVLLGLGGFFAWAALAPLDEGVHAMGTLIVDSKRKTVQNSSPGVVKEIHVKEGDLVKTDQLLVTMDPIQARAQREIADSLYLTARATEHRLLAEQQLKAQVSFPLDLMQRESQAAVSLVLNSQRQLFVARRKALESELGAYRESIAGLQSQAKGLEEVQSQRIVQVQTLQREVESLAPLVQDGLFSRNRHQELERQLANARASFADGVSAIARIGNQIAEAKLRIAQREQEYRKEVETQLSEASKEARAQAERLIALDDELRRTEVRSPVDGAVVGLMVTTRGAVLPAASRILDVIPNNEQMLIEAQVEPHLIERIKAGVPAKLMFTALNPRTTPVVDGKLLSISADLLQTPQGIPYYLARIELPPDQLRLLGQVELHAGMPVDVILVTGERSLLNYLLKPIEDRMARGLKER
jgi:protease secretion system membrane fusion protein